MPLEQTKIFPDKPLYYAEFAKVVGEDVLTIASFGWMLKTNEYEQRVYQGAIQIMQRITSGELQEQHAAYRYGGNFGNKKVWFYAPETELDEIVECVLS